MIAELDKELVHWLYGVLHSMPTQPGDFLAAIVGAAFRADADNYEIMRPALVQLKAKYPSYHADF